MTKHRCIPLVQSGRVSDVRRDRILKSEYHELPSSPEWYDDMLKEARPDVHESLLDDLICVRHWVVVRKPSLQGTSRCYMCLSCAISLEGL